VSNPPGISDVFPLYHKKGGVSTAEEDGFPAGKSIFKDKVSTHKGQAKKQHIIRQLPKKQTFVTK
jgi:hypothetical protein